LYNASLICGFRTASAAAEDTRREKSPKPIFMAKLVDLLLLREPFMVLLLLVPKGY
jgi:hypothetical protein